MPTAQASRYPARELRQLRFRLAATRVRLLAIRVGAGIANAASLLVGLFAAEMTLDWLVHLPLIARACFSIPAAAGAGWVLYREVILLLIRIPSDHAVACAVERATPEFQTRLIASIQLGRDGGARKSALVGALIRETAAMAERADFRSAARAGKLLRALRTLLIVFVISGGLWFAGRGNVELLFERAILFSTRLPSRTQLLRIDCPAKIALGADLKIDVRAGGIYPQSGAIEATAGARASEYRLVRDPAVPGLFHAVIESVTQSLTVIVRLGDARSDPIPVTVLVPPAVLGVKCLELFPAYTNLPPLAQRAGDLTLLAGSLLRLSVAASGPVKAGAVHLAGPEKDLPLTVDPSNPSEAHGDIPIPKGGLTGFSLHLVDENGIASRETALYHIDIQPDNPPAIRILHPASSIEETAGASEVIAFQAVDDFGLASVLLHYTVNDSPEKVIDLQIGGAKPRQIATQFPWKLAWLKLAPGSDITYWLEAVDDNNVTGPGRTLTDKYEIKIVTEDEKKAELQGEENDVLGNLNQVSQSEDETSQSLRGKLVPPSQSPPP